jgi:hypothetical protein
MMRDQQAMIARINEWAQLRDDLPKDWYVVSDPEHNVYQILWKHPELNKEFVLLRVIIRNDDTIWPVHNHLKYVARMLGHFNGFEHENRLIHAAKILTPDTPHWFITASECSKELDIKGVDGFATVLLDNGQEVRIPFQVKTGIGAVKGFFERWPNYQDIVAVVLSTGEETYEHLRKRFYLRVSQVRYSLVMGIITKEAYESKLRTLFGQDVHELLSAAP